MLDDRNPKSAASDKSFGTGDRHVRKWDSPIEEKVYVANAGLSDTEILVAPSAAVLRGSQRLPDVRGALERVRARDSQDTLVNQETDDHDKQDDTYHHGLETTHGENNGDCNHQQTPPDTPSISRARPFNSRSRSNSFNYEEDVNVETRSDSLRHRAAPNSITVLNRPLGAPPPRAAETDSEDDYYSELDGEEEEGRDWNPSLSAYFENVDLSATPTPRNGRFPSQVEEVPPVPRVGRIGLNRF
jgi:hypothetical protein